MGEFAHTGEHEATDGGGGEYACNAEYEATDGLAVEGRRQVVDPDGDERTDWISVSHSDQVVVWVGA